MIQTSLIQRLAHDKPLGFTRFGGTMRYYMNIVPVSQSDWLETLDYCIGREWIEPTGQIDGTGPVYDWRGKEKEKSMIEMPAGTPIRCNRCETVGPSPRAFQAQRHSSAALRIRTMMIHPICGHADSHFVYRSDIPLAQVAATLTSGTIASLTGLKRYDDIEEVQEAFVQWCFEHPDFETWQEAWEVYDAT